jgi:hypothetical protein
LANRLPRMLVCASHDLARLEGEGDDEQLREVA